MSTTETTPLLTPDGVQQQEDRDAGCLACWWVWRSPAVNQPEKRIQVPVKVEPKVYFANERTFLHWLSVSVLLGMMSLTILKADNKGLAPTVLGFCVLILSAVFMLYSLSVYYNRAKKIAVGDRIRFDDNKGPVVLVVALIIAFLSTGLVELGVLV